MKGYHVTRRSNLESIMEKGLIPNIPEDINDVCGVFLFPSIHETENGLMNWFGQRIDEIEEDEEIEYDEIILEVDLTGLEFMESLNWEIICFEIIDPSRIKLH